MIADDVEGSFRVNFMNGECRSSVQGKEKRGAVLRRRMSGYQVYHAVSLGMRIADSWNTPYLTLDHTSYLLREVRTRKKMPDGYAGIQRLEANWIFGARPVY